MEPIHVVAAVIRSHGKVLLAKRAKHKHQGGLWEFPGGKIECHENAEQALKRELKEELAIDVMVATPLFQTDHQYPEYAVHLDIWEVTEFEGEARGAEGQDIIWVNPRHLLQYKFPAANTAIVTAARLPRQYLMIPESLEPLEMISGVRRAVEQGIKLICLAAPPTFDAAYRDMAVDLVGVCAAKAQLMLSGAFEWLGDFPVAGWHVSAKQLKELAAKGRPLADNRLLAASCHCQEDLELARQFGVDFVTFSPLQTSLTNPEQFSLDWDAVIQLIKTFDRPVYVSDRLDECTMACVQYSYVQGIAGTLGIW